MPLRPAGGVLADCFCSLMSGVTWVTKNVPLAVAVAHQTPMRTCVAPEPSLAQAGACRSGNGCSWPILHGDVASKFLPDHPGGVGYLEVRGVLARFAAAGRSSQAVHEDDPWCQWLLGDTSAMP